MLRQVLEIKAVGCGLIFREFSSIVYCVSSITTEIAVLMITIIITIIIIKTIILIRIKRKK